MLEADVDFTSKTAKVTVEAGTKVESVLAGLKGGYSGKVQQ